MNQPREGILNRTIMQESDKEKDLAELVGKSLEPSFQWQCQNVTIKSLIFIGKRQGEY